MLRRLSSTLAVLFLVSGCSTSLAKIPAAPRSQASIGPGVSGGGDAISLEVVTIAHNLLQKFMRMDQATIDKEKFMKAILSTKVNTTDEVLKDSLGREVHVLNFPQASPPRILVQRQAWDRIKDQPYRKALLVMHEYLGVMGVEDSNYQVSSTIDHAKICSRSIGIVQAIEMRFNGVECYRLFPEDLSKLEGTLQADVTAGLKVGDFDHLDKIQEVELRGNTVAPADLFAGMQSLINVELIGFTKIQTHALRRLKLHQVRIATDILESRVFSGTTIQILDIMTNSHKQPTKYEPGVFDGASVDSVRFRERHDAADFDRSRLSGLQSLLNLEFQSFTEINDKVYFANIKSDALIEHQNIRDVHLFGNFEPNLGEMFRPLANLENLYLSGTNIHKLSADDFQNSSKLEFLFLNNRGEPFSAKLAKGLQELGFKCTGDGREETLGHPGSYILRCDR